MYYITKLILSKEKPFRDIVEEDFCPVKEEGYKLIFEAENEDKKIRQLAVFIETDKATPETICHTTNVIIQELNAMR